MTRLKDITFESGSLTGTNGADSTTGVAVSLDSGSVLKGTYSELVNASGNTGYVQEDWTAVDTAYTSFYLKVTSAPGSVSTIFEYRDGSAALARVRINATQILLADGSNTQIGSGVNYSTNTIYRIGIRYTKGTGANAVVELFVIAGDSAFGAASASTSSGAQTTQVQRARAGAPANATFTIYIDNIRIDDTSMPTDDVAGGTTYNQSVNVTVSNSVSITKQVNKPLSFTSVSVFTITKQTTRTISISVPNSVAVIKQATKTISATIGNAVPAIVKQVNKNISTAVNTSASIIKSVTKSINVTIAANVVMSAGLLFYKTISVTVGNVVSMTKRINKIILVISHIQTIMERALSIFTLSFGRNIAAVSMKRANENTQTLTGTDSQTILLDPKDDTTL